MAITQQTVTVSAGTTSTTGVATATFTAGAKLIGAVPAVASQTADRPDQVTVRATINAGGIAFVQVTPALVPVDVLVTVDA